MDLNKQILLIVEDNALLVGLYRTAFENAGYAVLCAHDGDTGIVLAREMRPSNIILDLLMPGMDGFGMIKALKGDAETSDINIIVLTSDTKEEDLKRARDLGAVGCLAKSELSLAEIVKRAIECFK